MAQLPRWIDSWKVDSAAMLSAYLSVARDTAEHYGKLTMYIHNMDYHGVRATPCRAVSEAPCTQQECTRCITKRGGYVFRWYHPSWEKKYVELRRHPDAWKPGDPEQ